MHIWQVSYQTTHMGIFEWIGYARYVSHDTAIEGAMEVLKMSDDEEIINIRIRRETK